MSEAELSIQDLGEPLRFYEINKQQQEGSEAELSADFVIQCQISQPKKGASQEERELCEKRTLSAYNQLVEKLTKASLRIEARRVGLKKLFVFVLCPRERLRQEFDRSSVQDWIAGIRIANPSESNEKRDTVEDGFKNMSNSTRLRLVHHILVGPAQEGCAGIHVDEDDFVKDIYPLHNKRFNHKLLKNWATKWFITQSDLLEIRNHFGEKIAYYFEFLQFYFVWLAAPSIVGFFVYFLNAGFSSLYALFNVGWSLLFVEMWKRREEELATWWQVRHCSRLEEPRIAFRPERTIVDEITNEKKPYFPSWKRWVRRLLTIPMLGVIGGILFVVVALIYAFEVIIYEYYQGPFKNILYYAPLVAYSVAIWYFSDAYTVLAAKLNDFENYETESQHSYHYTYKLFVINFAVGYLFIFLEAWVYVPFSEPIGRLLSQFTGWNFKTPHVGVEKVEERVIYYVLTAQLINIFTEVVLPWLLRSATVGAKKVKNAVTHQQNEILDANERAFLKRISREDALPKYDVFDDYAEMVTQFGHVILFSSAWPLAPLLSFANNWIELRSDAFKVCVHTKRQVPTRVESIGPWADNLLFLSWFSSITNAIFVHQFGNKHSATDNTYFWPLVLIIVAEHLFFISRWLIRAILHDIPNWAVEHAKRNEHQIKQHWLKTMGADLHPNSRPPSPSKIPQQQDAETVERGRDEIRSAFKKA